MKFLPNYAEVATPLTDLIKMGQPNKVTWKEPQQKAFQKVRDMLGSAPVLRMLDFDKMFIIQADASDIGIGAIFLQEYPDELFPVLCASKKLLSRERNHSVNLYCRPHTSSFAR